MYLKVSCPSRLLYFIYTDREIQYNTNNNYTRYKLDVNLDVIQAGWKSRRESTLAGAASCLARVHSNLLQQSRTSQHGE
jgi:hypothetical protein